MALMRGRLLAGALFVGLLFGEPATVPSTGGGEVSGGNGGGKVTFGPRHYARLESADWDRTDPLVFDTQIQNEDDEEAVIVAVLAEAVMRYYT